MRFMKKEINDVTEIVFGHSLIIILLLSSGEIVYASLLAYTLGVVVLTAAGDQSVILIV